MDPRRFELTTPGLQDQSSTTELNLGRKFCQKIQSSTKAMVKELIYEAKYQSSARPGTP